MIDFQTESVEMPDIDRSKVRTWLSQVAQLHGKQLGDITYMFCNDAEILRVNKEFLNHDYYTDIITFDYTRGNRISGDLLISLDTVRSNSEALNVEYAEELMRVIIHGVLHLCGINDKGLGERIKMEAAENEALQIYKNI